VYPGLFFIIFAPINSCGLVVGLRICGVLLLLGIEVDVFGAHSSVGGWRLLEARRIGDMRNSALD
jgi:hypothetical protein